MEKIKGYTLHGDYYLADKIILGKNWKEALKMKEIITLPNGKKVIAHTLSKNELETIPGKERTLHNWDWYWTSTPKNDKWVWCVNPIGDFNDVDYAAGDKDEEVKKMQERSIGIRLGFKNPFKNEKSNTIKEEIFKCFNY